MAEHWIAASAFSREGTDEREGTIKFCLKLMTILASSQVSATEVVIKPMMNIMTTKRLSVSKVMEKVLDIFGNV